MISHKDKHSRIMRTEKHDGVAAVNRITCNRKRILTNGCAELRLHAVRRQKTEKIDTETTEKQKKLGQAKILNKRDTEEKESRKRKSIEENESEEYRKKR